jgi:hypothetical protein
MISAGLVAPWMLAAVKALTEGNFVESCLTNRRSSRRQTKCSPQLDRRNVARLLPGAFLSPSRRMAMSMS